MTRLTLFWCLIGGALALSGCSDDYYLERSVCEARVRHPTLEGAGHVPACTPVSYESNPPSSGTHFAQWAAWGAYESPLPRGYWVHDLEHGAVVFSYHCEDGCPEEVALAKKMLSELPEDKSCGAERRVLLTPDPLLGARWAASAWGVTLTATCFDRQTFESFFVAHHGNAPEDECASGVELRNADGSLSLPPGCDSDPDGGTQ